jgi:hypothetical protein
VRGGVCSVAAGVYSGCGADGGAPIHGEAEDFELLPAVGEVDGGGGEGGAPGLRFNEAGE